MAKTGKKQFTYAIENSGDLAEIFEFTEKRAKINGLRFNIEYKHDMGLLVSVSGPKDKVNLFDFQMRDYFEELYEY